MTARAAAPRTTAYWPALNSLQNCIKFTARAAKPPNTPSWLHGKVE